MEKDIHGNARELFPYGRLKEILSWFLSHEGFVTSAGLAKRFGISERTLRTDIHNLNDILKQYDSQIVQKRGQGYTLETCSFQLLRRLLSEAQDTALDTADKRINLLIMTLLYEKDYVSQNQLADTVYVSINTILNYLKAIRSILEGYSLRLLNKVNRGYKIEGSETDKRICIMDLLEGSLQEENFQFMREYHTMWEGIPMEEIQRIVLEFSQDNSFYFSDYSLRSLVWQIALSVSRMRSGNELKSYQAPEDARTARLLTPLMERLEKLLGVTFPQPEKCYLYSCYILNAANFPSEDINMDYVRGLVTRILQNIYDCYQIDVRDDAILVKNLTHHLHSILQSKYYQLNKKNPLLEVIRQNYLLFYEITETAVYETFQDEPFTMKADDIGYICLHVGAAVKRYFDARDIRKRRTVIVTPGGYSVGSFLETQLDSLFEDRLEIVGKTSFHELENYPLEGVDFIISTVPLKEEKLPMVLIEIPLSKKNIEEIFREIVAGKAASSGWMDRLFRSDCFWRMKSRSREEVIHQMSAHLLKKGYVNENFEEEVLEREKRIPTVMNEVIAIPHPLQISARENVVAVGILEKPVSWGEGRQAQIILMLALSENYGKDVERLYDLLVDMMNHGVLQERLLESRSMKEFLDITEAYLGRKD